MALGQAFNGGTQSAVRWFADQPGWWDTHYVGAVDEVRGFLEGDGVDLTGRRVLDLGCGDGIIALGLAARTRAASVLGLDLQPVDVEFLSRVAAEYGVAADHPNLSFGVSSETDLGIPDDSVDLVVTWSVFEHVADVRGLLEEIRRVLVTDGLLFIQIWPLFYSEHGSHLWPWFDQPYPHLRLSEEEISAEVHRRTGSPTLARAMLDQYHSCNRITLDELGTALRASGFFISKVATDAAAVHVPPELQGFPLSHLTTAGLKIVAVKPGAPATSAP